MHVEWQGDHRLLGDDVKQDLERELTRLGLDPSKFLVEVRREPDLPGADGLDAIRYDVYITDLEPRIAIHGSYTAGRARTGSRSSPKSAVGSMFRGRVECGEHAMIAFLAWVPPLTPLLLMIVSVRDIESGHRVVSQI